MSTNTHALAEAVRARRADLGLTHDDVATAGGPSDTTLSNLEQGRLSTVANVTLRRLDTALQWEQGSAARVLAGGSPRPIDETPRGLADYTDVELATELLRRLTERSGGSDASPIGQPRSRAGQAIVPTGRARQGHDSTKPADSVSRRT